MKTNSVIISSLDPLDNTFLSLEYISIIYYPIQFKKFQIKIQALVNSDSKINVITWLHTIKLSFKI